MPNISTEHQPNVAYVTLVTSDAYVLGALVLSQSLRSFSPSHNTIVMVTAQVTQSLVDLLRIEYTQVIQINTLRSNNHQNLQLLQRLDLDVTFSKLHVWTLIQFDKVVFLDADTLIVSNIDDLFLREELSAAPDCGWPDIFNSGVFVLKPSMDTFERLIAFSGSRGSWDGGDQGLLNEFFSEWNTTPGRRLPFVYNVTPTSVYTYAPAYERFQNDIKVIHFAGPNKPWTYSRTSSGSPLSKESTPAGSILFGMVMKWWSVFNQRESSWGYLFGSEDARSYMINQMQTHQSRSNQSGYNIFNTFSGAGYTQNTSGPSIDINYARYTWPEHEFDEAELENWRISMSSRRGSFPRRRSSVTQDLKTSPTLKPESLMEAGSVQRSKSLSKAGSVKSNNSPDVDTNTVQTMASSAKGLVDSHTLLVNGNSSRQGPASKTSIVLQSTSTSVSQFGYASNSGSKTVSESGSSSVPQSSDKTQSTIASQSTNIRTSTTSSKSTTVSQSSGTPNSTSASQPDASKKVSSNSSAASSSHKALKSTLHAIDAPSISLNISNVQTSPPRPYKNHEEKLIQDSITTSCMSRRTRSRSNSPPRSSDDVYSTSDSDGSPSSSLPTHKGGTDPTLFVFGEMAYLTPMVVLFAVVVGVVYSVSNALI